jgi:hypothetical protein
VENRNLKELAGLTSRVKERDFIDKVDIEALLN